MENQKNGTISNIGTIKYEWTEKNRKVLENQKIENHKMKGEPEKK